MSVRVDGDTVVIAGVVLMDTQRRPIQWSKELLDFFAMCERHAKRAQTHRRRRTSRYLSKGGVKR